MWFADQVQVDIINISVPLSSVRFSSTALIDDHVCISPPHCDAKVTTVPHNVHEQDYMDCIDILE
jgi:hypothetical protein